MILVTGGAGFIGSNFILDWLHQSDELVVNFDKLTYAGNLANLSSIEKNTQYIFIQGDICDSSLVYELLCKYRPRAILNFAAESHVDRSILGPKEFIQTNIFGTYQLLESARAYWTQMPEKEKDAFRFLQISTDEIYGSLEAEDPPFSETNRIKPNSPYSATKASADHLVRSWHHTFGLPVLTSNCSNNYGPYQFPEKLIPLMITSAIAGKHLPLYGDGKQIRDWLYVQDHCSALRCVLSRGRVGEVYNIGGCNEKSNFEIVQYICSLLDSLYPKIDKTSYQRQIVHIKDRPGHDRRYAINSNKIASELGWSPTESFETGIQKTVEWYINNPLWVSNVQSGNYRNWLAKQYGTNP